MASKATVSTVLVQDDKASQKPIYFVSRTFQGIEAKYLPIEKLGLALVLSTRKLRPYFQAHQVIVLTTHPLRQLLYRPLRLSRQVRWALELVEFDIIYRPRTAIKAQVLVDFVNELMLTTVAEDKEWKLLVDGSSTCTSTGLGVAIMDSVKAIDKHAIKLGFVATNNEAEYEAFLASLRLAKAKGIT